MLLRKYLGLKQLSLLGVDGDVFTQEPILSLEFQKKQKCVEEREDRLGGIWYFRKTNKHTYMYIDIVSLLPEKLCHKKPPYWQEYNKYHQHLWTEGKIEKSALGQDHSELRKERWGSQQRQRQNFKLLVCALSHSVVSDSVTQWTVAHQAPLSMGFPSQECWNGLPFPSPGNLPSPGIEATSLVSVSCIGRWILYHCTTCEAWISSYFWIKHN